MAPTASGREPSPYYGALQDMVDSLFPATDDDPAAAVLAQAGLGPQVRRLDIVMAAEAADLPDELREVVNLLPPGDYTRQRLCVQLNSAIGGHAWGQVYGTVE
ncbi:hypothetical protein [Adlercreutzia aquisgranensis]|uniref:hypothetical protein n=1 Tax=Adlercreutzia aquisgranensis TaxID=2941323 RepID=UPI00203D4042|nr:hypothetical protein [Adlercreutzia aquisgranensis]